jgi:hypothetical protein
VASGPLQLFFHRVTAFYIDITLTDRKSVLYTCDRYLSASLIFIVKEQQRSGVLYVCLYCFRKDGYSTGHVQILGTRTTTDEVNTTSRLGALKNRCSSLLLRQVTYICLHVVLKCIFMYTSFISFFAVL